MRIPNKKRRTPEMERERILARMTALSRGEAVEPLVGNEVADGAEMQRVRQNADMLFSSGITDELLAVELNGHSVLTQPANAYSALLGAPTSSVEQLTAAYRENLLPLEHFVPVGEQILMHPCRLCGNYPLYETNGVVIRPVQACPAANGVTVEFHLDVPSGVIVLAPDLRPVFEVPGHGRGALTIETVPGTIALTQAYQAIGCAFAETIDNRTGFYCIRPDHYIIARPAYDRDSDKTTHPQGRLLGWFDTRYFYMADAADFDAKRPAHGEMTAHMQPTRIPVRAGRYLFTQHRYEGDFEHGDGSKTIVYLDVEFLRPLE